MKDFDRRRLGGLFLMIAVCLASVLLLVAIFGYLS